MYDFTQPGPLAPQPPKKSILDTVLEHLYPSGAFEGLLSPDVLKQQRMMALTHAGLSLMAAPASIPGQPPHTFLGDLAAGLDPQGFQEQLGQTAQTALALHGAQRKLNEEAQIDAILARHPVVPGATPQQRKQRFQSMAEEFSAAGAFEPAQMALKMGAEIGPEPVQGFAPGTEIADSQGNPIRTVTPKLETDMMKLPDGSQQLINKQNGDVIKTFARGQTPFLTDEEKASLTPTYQGKFEQEIATPKNQLDAYKAYNATKTQVNTKTRVGGTLTDPILLANALRILVPAASVTTEQILAGQTADFGSLPIIGPLFKAFNDQKGELTDAQRAVLDALVQQQMPNVIANAKAIIARHTATAKGVGLDPSHYIYDPTRDEASLTPISTTVRKGANKIRRINGLPENK